MGPDIIAVIDTVLVKAYTGQDLRHKHPQHIRIVQQHLRRIFSAQDPRQLRLNPFRGDERHDCPLPLSEKSVRRNLARYGEETLRLLPQQIPEFPQVIGVQRFRPGSPGIADTDGVPSGKLL